MMYKIVNVTFYAESYKRQRVDGKSVVLNVRLHCLASLGGVALPGSDVTVEFWDDDAATVNDVLKSATKMADLENGYNLPIDKIPASWSLLTGANPSLRVKFGMVTFEHPHFKCDSNGIAIKSKRGIIIRDFIRFPYWEYDGQSEGDTLGLAYQKAKHLAHWHECVGYDMPDSQSVSQSIQPEVVSPDEEDAK